MLVRLHGQIIINSGDLPCELGFLPSKTYWELAKSFPILFLPGVIVIQEDMVWLFGPPMWLSIKGLFVLFLRILKLILPTVCVSRSNNLSISPPPLHTLHNHTLLTTCTLSKSIIKHGISGAPLEQLISSGGAYGSPGEAGGAVGTGQRGSIQHTYRLTVGPKSYTLGDGGHYLFEGRYLLPNFLPWVICSYPLFRRLLFFGAPDHRHLKSDILNANVCTKVNYSTKLSIQ